MMSTLSVVATPIGNLADISLRAIEVLKKVSAVACEDTRHTRKLLTHYNLAPPLVSYHEHNKFTAAKKIIARLKNGEDIALVSDAGTPGISDPGYRIIREAIDAGVKVEYIPGPSAIIAGLVLSGLPSDRFIFEGFLPNKGAARRNKLAKFKDEERTIIFYESPHRLLKCLEDIAAVLGDVNISVSREITKKFEETVRGTVSEVLARFKEKGVKGEFVIVVSQKT